MHVVNSFISSPLDIPKNIFWRLPKTKSQQKHVFIIGAPRSGTTLIKSILCAHPNFKSITYETTGIFQYRNIFDLNGYNHIFKNDNFSSQQMTKVIDRSSNIIELFDNFCFDYLPKDADKKFVEKINTITMNRVKLLLNYFPNSQFVHIYRDGRDCFCSARHHPHVYQGQNVERFAKHWKNCINSRLNVGEHPNLYDISYESLTSELETVNTVKKLMDFLGEKYYANLIDPQHYENKYMSKANHHNNLSKPIKNTSQGRWKKELTNAEIDRFQKLAGLQLKKLGYALENIS